MRSLGYSCGLLWHSLSSFVTLSYSYLRQSRTSAALLVWSTHLLYHACRMLCRPSLVVVTRSFHTIWDVYIFFRAWSSCEVYNHELLFIIISIETDDSHIQSLLSPRPSTQKLSLVPAAAALLQVTDELLPSVCDWRDVKHGGPSPGAVSVHVSESTSIEP